MKNKTFTISEKKLNKIIKRVIDEQETPCFGRRPYDEIAERNGLQVNLMSPCGYDQHYKE